MLSLYLKPITFCRIGEKKDSKNLNGAYHSNLTAQGGPGWLQTPLELFPQHDLGQIEAPGPQHVQLPLVLLSCPEPLLRSSDRSRQAAASSGVLPESSSHRSPACYELKGVSGRVPFRDPLGAGSAGHAGHGAEWTRLVGCVFLRGSTLIETTHPGQAP